MGDVIGKMNQRIQIATKVATPDAYNGEQISWSLSGEIWANVEHKATGTDEEILARQNSPDERVLFTVRFRTVAYDSEIVYRGLRYKIEGVLPDHHRTYVTIETKQKGPQDAQ